MILGILFITRDVLVYSYPDDQTNDTFLGFTFPFLAHILTPKTTLCDKKFHLKVHQVEFVGHPTLLNVDRPGTGLIYSRKVQKSILKASNQSAISMYHIVFAMGNCQKDEIDLVYENCLLNLTAGFKYEQLRRGYISSETELILNIKEEYHRKSMSENDLQTRILEASSLARTLTKVYKAMKGQEDPHILINNSVNLSFQPDLNKLRMLGKPILLGTFKTTYPNIRPFYSLLLHYDPEQILANLPKDSSPVLINLIQSVTPTTSFEQLQTILNVSLSQIYRFASHLHFWGQARIIQVISSKNFYTLSETADFSNFAKLSSEFNTNFAPLEMVTLLNQLSIPGPYNKLIHSRELRNLYLEAIAFLLRSHLVIQLHMYLLLLVPGRIVQKVTNIEGAQPVIIPEPGNPSPIEAEYIKLMILSQPNPTIQGLFERLVPYMNGMCHLDEITFQENITRKELKNVMNHYNDEIITSLHQ
ncbi:nitrogen permease regulator of amino acid transport activity 3-domain-containing protein [Globomyces pollinis-pini]|nr:nitrogen permease regulator of amino acid transport activity 3-domain-containing protein [Globomyces pollinis-pini]